jgi:hypothetical protein
VRFDKHLSSCSPTRGMHGPNLNLQSRRTQVHAELVRHRPSRLHLAPEQSRVHEKSHRELVHRQSTYRILTDLWIASIAADCLS